MELSTVFGVLAALAALPCLLAAALAVALRWTARPASPLVVGFFSSRDRVTYLFNPELQVRSTTAVLQ